MKNIWNLYPQKCIFYSGDEVHIIIQNIYSWSDSFPIAGETLNWWYLPAVIIWMTCASQIGQMLFKTNCVSSTVCLLRNAKPDSWVSTCHFLYSIILCDYALLFMRRHPSHFHASDFSLLCSLIPHCRDVVQMASLWLYILQCPKGLWPPEWWRSPGWR